MNSEQVIRDLESRRYKAMCEVDTATLDELLAEEMIYTHSHAVVDDKRSYIEGIVSQRWPYAAVERPVEKIDVFGDTARVTGQVRLTLKNQDGTTRSVMALFMDVWVRRNARWQMIAWQSTPLPA